VNAREIDELAGRLQGTDDKPDVIIGGPWPSKVPGARRVACIDCGCFISLAPASGAIIAAKWPDVPVVCFSCSCKRGEVVTGEEMTRLEHLEWAKRRALAYLGSERADRFRDTFASFASDLTRHPENKGRYPSGAMLVGLMAAAEENEVELRRWIGEFR
jgi:hypothetical protein